MMRVLRVWLAAVLAPVALAGWACQPQERIETPDREAPQSQEISQLQDSLQEVRAAIDAEIGEAQAEALAQCRLLPLGSRPCGGPSSYVAYSIAVTDSTRLADLAAVYRDLMQRRNEQSGLFSTCEVLSSPELALEGGRCVTVRTEP